MTTPALKRGHDTLFPAWRTYRGSYPTCLQEADHKGDLIRDAQNRVRGAASDDARGQRICIVQKDDDDGQCQVVDRTKGREWLAAIHQGELQGELAP